MQPASAASQSRTLKVPHIEQFEGKQLHYRVKNPEIFEGKNIVICGGGDSALDWCLNLVSKAESVVLVHRREGFRAAPASVSKMKELCDNWEMQFEVGQVTGFTEENGQMTEVKVTGADGVTRRIPAEHLARFLRLAAETRTDCGLGPDARKKTDRCGHCPLRNQHPGRFCRRRYQHLSGQKETDPVRFP